MNKLELQALVDQGEGFHLEFKEAINSNLSKEIVAFANAKGGRVLIGVDDDGNIKNKVLGNDDRSKIQDIARECDPSIDITIGVVDGEPNVLVLQVKEGVNKPYRSTGGFYMREGASSVKRTTQEIHQMFVDADRFSFDDALCVKADFNTHFAPNTLKRFFIEAGKEQMLSNEDTLHNLGVLEFVEGKPVLNNTGVLFFTKEPQRFLPQAIIQCVRYKGIIKVDIEDQKNMTFDVMTNIDECFTFLRRSLDVAFVFESGSPTRKEVWEIPYQALKEALVNAIAHRDYINKGTHIQVEVFDDRVSITNFGGLVAGLSQDDLGKRSLHRNPNIVNLLHRANFIEKLGTGLLRIDNELEQAGLPKVEFDINDNWFSIIFKRKGKKIEKIELPKLDFVLDMNDLKILRFCMVAKPRKEVLVNLLKITNRRENYEKNMEHLVKAGLLNMTNPDAPTDPTQKYYTSELGKDFVNDAERDLPF